jgi:hypothetical protein
MVSSKSWGALVVGVLAVIVRLDERFVSSINGVTQCTYVNYAGIGLGAVALLIGVVAAWEAATGVLRYQGGAKRGRSFAVVAVAAGLGVMGLLQGFAIIMSPCAGIS